MLAANNNDTYSVYCHINKVNGKKYVGKAKSIAKRWGNHGHGYTSCHDTIFASAINKYGWDNFEHIILADGLSNEAACELEVWYIKEWKTNICRHGSLYGYNMTDGGEGQPGGSSGTKSVFCVTTGELFPSVTVAAEKYHISVTHLTAVCKGRRKSAFGLCWRYATDEDTAQYLEYGNPNYSEAELNAILDNAKSSAAERAYIERFTRSNKPVVCEELNIILPSIKAASIFTMKDMRCISSSVNSAKRGERISAGGLHWRFATREEVNSINGGKCMQGKFIYVFNAPDRDRLISLGYKLLKTDERNNIYVFIFDNDLKFTNIDVSFILSDTLTF